MKIITNIVENSKYSLVFIHGWGGNENSLKIIESCFHQNYSTYLLCLSGFDKKIYSIDDYLLEVDNFLITLKNVVLIGHSFGGKIALMLKLMHPEYIVFALAPSIYKNPFSLKIFLKIRLYKLLKFLHFKIPNFLKGSNDYKKCEGLMKQTFLNVCHAYLSDKDIEKLTDSIIFGFTKDKEVKLKSLKKITRLNKKIKLYIFNGNHFAYYDYFLEIYHIINSYLKENFK